MTNRVILIADGGSTKCQWALSLANSESIGSPKETERIFFETQGVNPSQMSLFQIEEILGMSPMWQSIREGAVGSKYAKVSEIRYYGAGCVGGEVNARMAEALKNLSGCSNILVASDMLGAAQAALGRERGVVAILGTGANTCSYDGSHLLRNVRPLGYILGDEGSGADIGKHVVADGLKGLWDSRLTDELYAFARADYSDIIRHIYAEPRANAYLANFAQFAAQHRERPEIKKILSERFDAFVVRNLLQYSAEELLGGVSMVGSVACEFALEIKEACQRHGIMVGKIIRRPLEGMVDYAIENCE